MEWSEWSPCGASCGSSTQSRWSRCADSGAMMECIQAGGEKKVTRTCNSVPCSQLEVVVDELHYNSHITADDISRVRKHQKLDREIIRRSKNSSMEKSLNKEIHHSNKEEEYPIDKLVLGKLIFERINAFKTFNFQHISQTLASVTYLVAAILKH